jgi:hypothetical protein
MQPERTDSEAASANIPAVPPPQPSAAPPIAPPRPGSRIKPWRVLVLVVCCLAFAFIASAGWLQREAVFGANDASRWDTVWSLTHGKGYVIDKAPYDTIDKVFRDGHFYSSKPALLPAVVAAITLAISKVTGLDFTPGNDFLLTRLVLLAVNLVPFTLFLYFYGNWLVSQPCARFAKLFCLCSAGLGTYLTAYTITLNNHTVAAVGAFFAVLLFMRILSGESTDIFTHVLCGIFSAWAIANELVAWPFWFFIAGYLFHADRGKTLRFFLPGSLLVAIPFLIATCIATGDCIPFYLKHRLYQYPGSYWYHPFGIDAAEEPKTIYFFNHVLGHHGILSLTPIFVFAFAGMASARTFKPLRIGAIALTALNFVSVIFKSHNYGGVCQGARWFMWLIPIWLFCMPQSVDRLTRKLRWKLLALFALLLSMASVLFGTLAYPSGPWSSSWLQNLMEALGWIDY